MPDPRFKIKNKTTTSTGLPIPMSMENSPVDFVQSWINSPEYNRRLQSNYPNPNEVLANRQASLSNLDIEHDYGTKTYAETAPTIGSKSFININPKDFTTSAPETLLSHELSHIVGAKDINSRIGLSDIEKSLLKESIVKQKPSISTKQGTVEQKLSQKEFDDWKHLLNPGEIKADLDATRFQLFNKGLYDITKGKQFTKEDLNKAKQELKDDNSFKRLLEQVGDDNYINLMNTIAMNKPNRQLQAKYGGKINPVQQQYFLGGAFETGEAGGASPAGMGMGMIADFIPQQNKRGLTSIGGSTASGALKGASMGSAAGPWGAAAGAVIGGGIGLIQAKKQRQEEEAAIQSEADTNSRQMLANMNYGQAQASNLPMAMGGAINPMMDNPVGTFSSFEGGGTHEQNPYGGIPQGMNSNNQMQTVEAGEASYKFPDAKYIFSNRLKFE